MKVQQEQNQDGASMSCPNIKTAKNEPLAEDQLIGAFVPKAYKALVIQITKARQESVSVFIRRAILKELASLGYLDDETKRSLGVGEYG